MKLAQSVARDYSFDLTYGYRQLARDCCNSGPELVTNHRSKL